MNRKNEGSQENFLYDLRRLRNTRGFDPEELDLLFSTVPIHHILRLEDLEAEEDDYADELFKVDTEYAAKQKEAYLAKYPDPLGEPIPQKTREKPSEEVGFDKMCDDLPEFIRDYGRVYLDEECPEVSAEEVEISRKKYKRLNDLIGKLACDPPEFHPSLEDVDLWMPERDNSDHPEPFEKFLESDSGWEKLMKEVREEVEMVKVLSRNERCQPVIRENVTSLDQLIGAVEKETGIPFNKDFASSFADVAAGRDNDVSLTPHTRSLDCDPLEEQESEMTEEKINDLTGTRIKGSGTSNAHPAKRRLIPSDPATKLEFELREYVQAKTQFLLSQIHDDGTVGKMLKGKLDALTKIVYPKRSYYWIDEEPREYIVLRNEDGKKKRMDIVVNYNENLDKKLSELCGNHKTEDVQKGECDVASFVRLLLSSPHQARSENAEGRDGTDADPNSKLGHNKETEQQTKGKDFREEPKEQQERRKKLMERRKMYRWERWIADNPQFLDSGTPIDAVSVEDQKEPVEIRETRQERRERMADSLFQDDSKKFVHYIDSASEVVQPLLPVLTAAVLVRGAVPEIHSPFSRPLEAQDDVESHRKPQVDKCVTTPDGKGNQKEKISKKDKKKKKRKSSSSSDDLETLEKRSEARLGMRK